MKVGILTVHHTYNFGAILQAFASVVILRRLNHEAELIDYDNLSFINRRRIFLPLNSIGNFFRNVRNLFNYRALKRKIANFELFYSQMPVSPNHWINHIYLSNSNYDVVMTGSDQTFGLYLTNNPSEMKPFFLEEKGQYRKISYASSMGEKTDNLTPSDIQWMSNCWSDFDKLLVRESFTQEFIKKHTGLSSKKVLDPTLLLSSHDWQNILPDFVSYKEKYIVFYTVLSSADVIKYTKELSKKMGLKVIALHSPTRNEIFSPFTYKSDAGPYEFLNLIKHAELVVTTSFHATVFSLIFNKPFVSLKQGKGNRISSLLKDVGLEMRYVCPSQAIDDEHLRFLQSDIDYKTVNSTLEHLRKESIEDLNSAING